MEAPRVLVDLLEEWGDFIVILLFRLVGVYCFHLAYTLLKDSHPELTAPMWYFVLALLLLSDWRKK